MLEGNLYSILWKYVSGMMHPWYVFGKYGKFNNGINKDHLLWGFDGGYNVDSHA